MKQRIITAIIALIIFVPFVIIGGMPFQLLVYAMATIGFVELIRMGKISKYSIPSILGIGLVWLILMQESNTDLTPLAWFTKSEVIMLMVLLLLSYTVLVKNKFTFDHAGVVLLSAIYVGMGFYYLIEARVGPESTDALATILYVFLIIWATDTGAYFFGRAFGKRKLWPKISPNKTVEGALGGVFLAIVVGVIFQAIHPIEDSFLAIISVSLLASIFGQIGDLVESAFKRHYEVKDSGNVLPGHGGILDRFDSLLFVMPILHLVGFFN